MIERYSAKSSAMHSTHADKVPNQLQETGTQLVASGCTDRQRQKLLPQISRKLTTTFENSSRWTLDRKTNWQ